MTRKEKETGKILLKILNDYKKEYERQPKECKYMPSDEGFKEKHKQYCAGASFAMRLCINLVELFFNGNLEKTLTE